MPNRRPAPARRPSASGRFAWFVVIVGLISAAALAFYGFWHGGYGRDTHSEWLRLAEEMRANGEPVTFADVRPADVPDVQNFFRAEVFAGLPEDNPRDPLLQRAVAPGGGLSVSDLLAAATNGTGASLETIAAKLQAAGFVRAKTDFLLAGDRVRAGLRALGLDFSPLAAAADRPASRFPVDYKKPFPLLPHLPYLEAVGDWLAIRAIAQLSIGDGDAASVDLLLIGRLADSVAGEPFLASQRTRRLLLGLFAGCVRVGIAWGAWNDEELERFAAAFEKARLVTDLAWAVRGERAQVNSAINLAFNGERPAATETLQAWLGPDLVKLDRRGLRAREVAINRVVQQYLNALAKPEGLVPADLAPAETAALPPSAQDRMKALAEEAKGAAQLQTYLGQAELACALERHRLKNGAYPETAAALVPDGLAALPVDPMNGQPLAYARHAKGGYAITGAGWVENEPWIWSRDEAR